LAYFANSATGAGVLGEALSATLNVNAMLWRTSPAATELELLTLDWLRQMIGLPTGFFGVISDTASSNTLYALTSARELHPELRWILDGCDRADSLVINPHKWLFTPMDCSALYTRRPELLKRAFQHVPDYLVVTESDGVANLMDYGVALGRRFRALKLWFVIRSFGVDGLRSLVGEHIRIAHQLA